MARNQVKFAYQIGVNTLAVNASEKLQAEWTEFKSRIIQHASELCGGCTVVDSTGYWIAGDTHAERFSGNVEQELCLNLELTTEMPKESDVYDSMAAALKRVAGDYPDLEIQWIHCSRFEIIGMHIDVSG